MSEYYQEWVAIDPQPKPLPRKAPDGTIYVCVACGKTANDYLHSPGGWDESCALNAVLCKRPDVLEPAP